MNFEFASMEDYDEIQGLYWDLIDKSSKEESFPDWKKGEHPSGEFLTQSIEQKTLVLLREQGMIMACAIVNTDSNEEYKRVPWKVSEAECKVWIIHALAVRYECQGKGLATQLVEEIISYGRRNGIRAIHLDVIDKNTRADKLYQKAGFCYVSTEMIFYQVVGTREFRMYEYVF